MFDCGAVMLLAGLVFYLTYRGVIRGMSRLPRSIETCLPLRGRWLGMLLAVVLGIMAVLLLVPVGYTQSNPGGTRLVFAWSIMFRHH